MKIFGREPTFWISVVSSVILLIGTFGLRWLDGDQAGLIVVVINAAAAALTAYAVRPIQPIAFTYLVGSIVALLTAYGLNLPPETVAATNVVVMSVLSLVARGEVAPQDTKISHS